MYRGESEPAPKPPCRVVSYHALRCLCSAAVYSAVLYSTLLYCIELYCTVMYCTVLYCTVLYCTVLHCTVLYSILLYCTVLYCTVLYCTVLYCYVLHCAALCHFISFLIRAIGTSKTSNMLKLILRLNWYLIFRKSSARRASKWWPRRSGRCKSCILKIFPFFSSFHLFPSSFFFTFLHSVFSLHPSPLSSLPASISPNPSFFLLSPPFFLLSSAYSFLLLFFFYLLQRVDPIIHTFSSSIPTLSSLLFLTIVMLLWLSPSSILSTPFISSVVKQMLFWLISLKTGYLNYPLPSALCDSYLPPSNILSYLLLWFKCSFPPTTYVQEWCQYNGRHGPLWNPLSICKWSKVTPLSLSPPPSSSMFE